VILRDPAAAPDPELFPSRFSVSAT